MTFICSRLTLSLHISEELDAIFPYHEGLAAVAVGCKTVRPADNPEHEYAVGGKWGFIDKQGNEVVPLQYDSIANYRQVKNNKVLVLKDGKWKALQLSGR